ncbi:hypothetical protein RAB80_014647 [Fusarium oxysporum f. sp. vasinfectum]|nr:hypothetical protein H9L39_17309 [Fusarium oxysporum f. sp. albedinis]KAK2669121.1 hypothetical protein RAB80_014647 [Fusarium oxysporum f. sp. vasinfectum]
MKADVRLERYRKPSSRSTNKSAVRNKDDIVSEDEARTFRDSHAELRGRRGNVRKIPPDGPATLRGKRANCGQDPPRRVEA